MGRHGCNGWTNRMMAVNAAMSVFFRGRYLTWETPRRPGLVGIPSQIAAPSSAPPPTGKLRRITVAEPNPGLSSRATEAQLVDWVGNLVHYIVDSVVQIRQPTRHGGTLTSVRRRPSGNKIDPTQACASTTRSWGLLFSRCATMPKPMVGHVQYFQHSSPALL